MYDLEREMSAERKRLHMVKHAPRSDEEILEILMKKHSEVTTSNRRANKDAKAELEQKKQKIADRDRKLVDASDVSEVESVIPSNALFSVDVNLDNLNSHLSILKKTLHE